MKVIKNNLKMLRYVWKSAKGIFLIAAAFCLCDVITPFQDTYLPKLIIDRLSDSAAFDSMIPLILLFVTVSLYKVVVWPLYRNYFLPVAKTKVSNALSIEMIGKIKELDLECFEDEAFYNRYTKALNELDSRACSVFESFVSFIRYLLYTGVLSGIIVTLDPVLLMLGAGCALLSFLCNRYVARLNHNFSNVLTAAQRRCDYVRRILYVPEYARETRMFPVTNLLAAKYRMFSEEKEELYKKYGRKTLVASTAPEIVTTVLLHGVVVAYLVWQIADGARTPGDFIALLLATSQFSNQLAGLGEQLNSFYSNSLYVEDLEQIFGYQSKVEGRSGRERPASFSEIRFRDVSFSYVGSERNVLEGIDLTLKKGEKVAIVGLNGSGKSTLIKLLLNLYNPTGGTVELNGQEVQKYSTEEYRKMFGVIFQDFHSLAFSVGENIALEELGNGREEEVRLALERTGMLGKVERLKMGIHTPVTKELSEDGTEFSRGEMQSIMLSRLFLKAYDILVLDEPTSALDPYAEYRLYSQLFSKKAEGQTVITVSHRLLATRDADVIYYMENGRIVEKGSHVQLMEQGGKYAQMYHVQQYR